jgi:hypothetical protein
VQLPGQRSTLPSRRGCSPGRPQRHGRQSIRAQAGGEPVRGAGGEPLCTSASRDQSVWCVPPSRAHCYSELWCHQLWCPACMPQPIPTGCFLRCSQLPQPLIPLLRSQPPQTRSVRGRELRLGSSLWQAVDGSCVGKRHKRARTECAGAHICPNLGLEAGVAARWVNPVTVARLPLSPLQPRQRQRRPIHLQRRLPPTPLQCRQLQTRSRRPQLPIPLRRSRRRPTPSVGTQSGYAFAGGLNLLPVRAALAGRPPSRAEPCDASVTLTVDALGPVGRLRRCIICGAAAPFERLRGYFAVASYEVLLRAS